MDGNRRWAAARGLPSIAGHVQGPDFNEADLEAALAEFTRRQRRFGS